MRFLSASVRDVLRWTGALVGITLWVNPVAAQSVLNGRLLPEGKTLNRLSSVKVTRLDQDETRSDKVETDGRFSFTLADGALYRITFITSGYQSRRLFIQTQQEDAFAVTLNPGCYQAPASLMHVSYWWFNDDFKILRMGSAALNNGKAQIPSVDSTTPARLYVRGLNTQNIAQGEGLPGLLQLGSSEGSFSLFSKPNEQAFYTLDASATPYCDSRYHVEIKSTRAETSALLKQVLDTEQFFYDYTHAQFTSAEALKKLEHEVRQQLFGSDKQMRRFAALRLASVESIDKAVMSVILRDFPFEDVLWSAFPKALNDVLTYQYREGATSAARAKTIVDNDILIENLVDRLPSRQAARWLLETHVLALRNNDQLDRAKRWLPLAKTKFGESFAQRLDTALTQVARKTVNNNRLMRQKFKSIDDERIYDTELGSGRYTLIDYWATWCPPCRIQIPYLQHAHEKYQRSGLDIVSVSLDLSTEDVKAYRKKWPMPWFHAFSGSLSPLEELGVNAIPTAFLLDPQGNVIAEYDALHGENLEKTLLSTFARQALADAR